MEIRNQALVLMALSILSLAATAALNRPRPPQERDGPEAVKAAAVESPFVYSFEDPGTLEEAGEMDESADPYWWLNSGGIFYFREGVGHTIQGVLPPDAKWRRAYDKANPTDTDGGQRPQNLLRLLTRSSWDNVRQEVLFKINAINLSSTPNRNESNGILLMSRYQDGDNLYYAGLRVDGSAVIKKKIKGVYYTLAQVPVFSAASPYAPGANPNLIPEHTWLGLRTETRTNADGNVAIKLFLDRERNNDWKLILEARDEGGRYGGAGLLGPAYAGLRTDFMDAEFDEYRLTDLP